MLAAHCRVAKRSKVWRNYHRGIVPLSDQMQQQREQLHAHDHALSVPIDTPIFQVYGSNTDVGKTVLTAGICRSAIQNLKYKVTYIKPIQTGTDAANSDAAFVKRNVSQSDHLHCETLFSWKTPVSPHLAAKLESKPLSDERLIRTLEERLQAIHSTPSPSNHLTLVETAGGVCSPTASTCCQADVYRALRLPVILIGDGKLGGISATISAMESLLIRGYDLAALCMLEQESDLNNTSAIALRLSELSIPLYTFGNLPPESEPLTEWYKSQSNVFDEVVSALDKFHSNREKRLHDLEEQCGSIFWWPFTQHKQISSKTPTVIDSAYGDSFQVWNKQRKSIDSMFDSCASWWTQGIGHGNAKMATSLAYAAGRFGHVMFPENVHEPAFRLAQRLLKSFGNGWASRVFFTDNGSTAVEVALKVAFRKYITDQNGSYEDADKLCVLAQANCYHGDTLGVMNIVESGVFNNNQHPWYRSQAVLLQVPSVAFRDGKITISLPSDICTSEQPNEKEYSTFEVVFDQERCQTDSLYGTYRDYVRKVLAESDRWRIGAAVMEPLLLGSGGMILVDPLFQRVIVEVCREYRIPVIYDEVFSGCWRLGVESGRDLIGMDPDISCFAKLLTGGVVPLAVTLTSEEIFTRFYTDSKAEALLHGHSFTANPVGCAAANTALDMYEIGEQSQKTKTLTCKSPVKLAALTQNMLWDQSSIINISKLFSVERAFAIGTVCVVELKSNRAGYTSQDAAKVIQRLRVEGVYARALGNVLYMMASPVSSRKNCDQWLGKLIKCLHENS
uniref:Adenosylmethionine8amino7oxononanoate aminotransferase putative n=1 Tax=Albugo laibachii Nc14 TaxID=890382 RepID=F0W7I0_9STRA|nr:adenosylmethionine8amino7oxononanoate aminotransferase putative [Albugo laibachii Nc14]|eukprot:CCA17081.1 adenosylmethionine8amino7oxononanoate aminotransferase putative [Albugo laibachii Nc14]